MAGLIGHPVGHSLSPVIHNAGFKAAGLDWVYLPFAVEAEYLSQVLEGFFRAGYIGLNITVPHKLRIMDLTIGLTEEAMRIGAVNLLMRGSDGWIGDNTDGQGFIKALAESGFIPRGKRALVLGAGGAARAVCHGLLGAGAEELYISNRTLKRAEELGYELSDQYDDVLVDVIGWNERSDGALLEEVDLVVNTTTVGMGAQETDLPVLSFASLDPETPGPWVADIVYSPLETPLIKAAKERGLSIISGEKMLLYQAVISWEAWTGRPAPVAEMVCALRGALQDR